MSGEAIEQEFERLRQGAQAMVNRVMELERDASQRNARESERATRVEEIARVVVVTK